MESKNGCVILKRKEYEKLVKQAEFNRPDFIKIDIWEGGRTDYISVQIDTGMLLSQNISRQIRQILREHYVLAHY